MEMGIEADVGSWFREVEERHVVEVTRHVLGLCRRWMAELDAAIQHHRATGGEFGPYLEQARVIVDGPSSTLDREYLDSFQLDAVATLLEGGKSIGDLVLRARDLATVLDDCRGQFFFSWFAGRHVPVAPNDAVPVSSSDIVAEQMGSERGLVPEPDAMAAPMRLGAPLDGTERLRLAPVDMSRFTLVLDARHHGVVDSLFSGTRPAAPGPNVRWAAAIPSCNVMADLTYDPVDHLDPPGFFAVRPKPESAAAYLRRVLQVLDVAAGAGAAIITLPELSTDEDVEAAVVRWFAAHPAVALLIAGSRHHLEPRRNRARVLMRGTALREPLIHDKYSSFSMNLNGVVREEYIERPNILTVVAGRRWSFCPLICKDFMEVVPRRIVADIRVRAVFVASMSPKTDLYVSSATTLAQDSQALVFISNAPITSEDDVAIFARPVRGAAAKTAAQHPTGVVACIETNASKFEILRPS